MSVKVPAMFNMDRGTRSLLNTAVSTSNIAIQGIFPSLSNEHILKLLLYEITPRGVLWPCYVDPGIL